MFSVNVHGFNCGYQSLHMNEDGLDETYSDWKRDKMWLQFFLKFLGNINYSKSELHNIRE